MYFFADASINKNVLGRAGAIRFRKRRLRLLHFTVADAGRANSYALARTLNDSMNSLKIQIPATLGHVVGVADAMPELRSATANFTYFRH